MQSVLIFFLASVSLVLGGPDDTLTQLEVGYGNVNMDNSFHMADVTVEFGRPPEWLSGSFVRHGCGIFGNALKPEIEKIDRFDHLFDCVEMGQSYSFHKGHAFFTSKFYDSQVVDYLNGTYDQDLSKSSVFYGTTYSRFNRTAIDLFRDARNNSDTRSYQVNHVSWWQVGSQVISMGETINGNLIDVHNVVEYPDASPVNGDVYSEDFTEANHGWVTLNPAHQTVDSNGDIISTTANFRVTSGILESRRLVYKVDSKTGTRQVIHEYKHEDADLSLCSEDNDYIYPDSDAMDRYMHSLTSTENYIILPETSYLYNPCERSYGDDDEPGYSRMMTYDNATMGRFQVIRKDNPQEDAIVIEADNAFFITHNFGAYEDEEEEGLIHVDVLAYKDEEIYTKFAMVKDLIYGTEFPEMTVSRFTLNITDPDNPSVSEYILAPMIPNSFVEFSNINPMYYGKKYHYGYATRNVFKLRNEIVKFDFETSKKWTYPMPNGLFAGEPIFVPSPGATEEDDGLVMTAGIDGVKEKGFIMILNAKNMRPEFHATAPELSLHGIHCGFFDFDTGCENPDGCVPEIPSSGRKPVFATVLLTAALTLPRFFSG